MARHAPSVEAILYAGCGIVAASDADREYRESCLKLRPLLEAMGIRDPEHAAVPLRWGEGDRV